MRTTSGKPKRRAMWQRLANGELDGATRWDTDGVAVAAAAPAAAD
jgi:hypothetical protein